MAVATQNAGGLKIRWVAITPVRLNRGGLGAGGWKGLGSKTDTAFAFGSERDHDR